MLDPRRIVVTLALGLTLAACQSEPPAIVGAWKADAEAMAKAAGQDLSSMPEAARAMFDDLMNMKVEADGTFTISQKNPMQPDAEPMTVSGSWKADGEQWQMTGKSAGADDEATFTARVEDGKLVLAKAGEETDLILVRAN